MAEVGIGVDWLALATAVVSSVAWLRQEGKAKGLRLLLLHFPSDDVTIEALQARLALNEHGEDKPISTKRARLEEDEHQQQEEGLAAWVRVLPPEAFVSHAALFPRCRAVAHHGGLGTTVACIRYVHVCGHALLACCIHLLSRMHKHRHGPVPQLVLPCTEEQALWGEVVAYKGLGLAAGLSLLQGEGVTVRASSWNRLSNDINSCRNYQPHALGSQTMASALAPAFAKLLEGEEEMRSAARQCHAAMAGEDGIGKAVGFLEGFMRARGVIGGGAESEK
jgi:hypothetical protein